MNPRLAHAGKKSERQIVDAVTAILDAAGVRWSLKRGRHLCIEVEGGAKMPVACSPRNLDRAVTASAAQARRLVRQIHGAAR